MRRFNNSKTFWLTLLLLAMLALPTLAQRHYTITAIGPLSGSLRSTATNLNQSGQIAGVSYGDAFDGFQWPPLPDTALGYVWDRGNIRPLLPPAGYQGAWAYGNGRAINDHGEVVGQAAMVDGSLPSPPGYLGHPMLVAKTPILWDKHGNPQTLPIPAGYVDAMPWTINNRGQIIGSVSDTIGALDPGPWGEYWMITPAIRAVLWNKNQPPVLLPLPPGFEGGTSDGTGINDSGQMTGTVTTADGSLSHAVMWDKGRVIDLTPLDIFGSSANNPNNRGQVVVNTDFGAKVWDRGNLTTLAAIPGDVWNWALVINDKGQVVGFSSGPDGDDFGRGVLWENGNIYDLNTLFDDPNDEWRLSWAYSINNKGEIVGFGQRKDANGDYQNVGFLLTPKKK